MKKLISFLLAACLMLALVNVSAAEPVLVYASDFAAGDDGWAGRGAFSYHTTEATLRTEMRTSDWNSPGRSFELVAGTEYDISVEIFQDEADSAEFIISLEHPDPNGNNWDRLVFGTVPKGEWTTVSGKYTAEDYESYLLYIETNDANGGHPTLSYEIRNFRLTAPNGVAEAKPTEAPAVIEEAGEVRSLKEAYAGKFDIGAAAPGYVFNLGQEALQKIILDHFNILTPENELKPDSVLDVNGSWRLAKETGDPAAVAIKLNAATPLLKFAQKNGIKVHGHVLVWHSQTPEAFFHEEYNSKKPYVSREVMLGRLENYIREVLTQTEEKFPGVIVSWDVVNEAIDDGTNWLRKTSNWTKVIGEDFINKAFEFARKYAAKGVLLYYNDYNTAYTGKLLGITKLLNMLIPEGNIDGYGFQMHHDTAQPSDALITAAVDKIAGLGIKLRVSELDVGINKFTDSNLQAQAKRYKFVMQLMLKYAEQTEAVQVWGLTDNMSWRSGRYPLLFDASMNPKPAFYAVLEALE